MPALFIYGAAIRVTFTASNSRCTSCENSAALIEAITYGFCGELGDTFNMANVASKVCHSS